MKHFILYKPNQTIKYIVLKSRYFLPKFDVLTHNNVKRKIQIPDLKFEPGIYALQSIKKL